MFKDMTNILSLSSEAYLLALMMGGGVFLFFCVVYIKNLYDQTVYTAEPQDGAKK